MIIGFLLIGVAMGFAVWKQMRLAAANPTTRLSGRDAQPPHPIVQPSGARLLNGAVVGFMLAANFRLQDANGHGWLWLLLICLVVTGAGFVPQVVHNRRVARTE